MDDGIPSSPSHSEMTSKKKKNSHATFKLQIKIHFLDLKTDYCEMYKNRSKIPAFSLKPLKAILNLVVEIISLQQLEY